MPNALYPTYRDRQLESSAPVVWLTDDIVVILCDVTYVYDEAHEFVDDLTGVVDTSPPLTGKTAVAGIADADNPTFVALTGADVERIIIAKDTGSAATSPLIAYIDTRTDFASVLIVPDGTDYELPWNDGTTRIFRL